MKPQRRVLAGIACLLAFFEAGAATLSVPGSYPTIQAAVAAAAPGDTVLVGAGTYQENLVITRTGITIDGTSAAQTIIDAGRRGRGMLISTARNVVVRNITVRNASTSQPGGGIYIDNSTNITISNSVLAANSAGFGGGLAVFSSDVSIVNNRIAGNQSTGAGSGGGGIGMTTNARGVVTGNWIDGNTAVSFGGGLFVDGSGSIDISNNTLSDNRAVLGGGALYRNAPVQFSGNVLVANRAVGNGASGGALVATAVSGIIARNTIDGNSVADSNGTGGFGGGLFIDGCPNISVKGNELTRNSATYGGGIAMRSSFVAFESNTVSDNTASGISGLGGGIYDYDGTVDVTNNVVNGNRSQGSDKAPGAGICLVSSRKIIVSGNTISNNVSSGAQHYGGGLYSYQVAALAINGNTFVANSGLDGGGIAIIQSNPAIASNYFSGNKGRWGGGLYGWMMAPTIEGNIFEGNIASDSPLSGPLEYPGGGAILFDESSGILRNNDIRNNRAQGTTSKTAWGGGIDLFKSQSVTIEGNRIRGNTADIGAGVAITPATSAFLIANQVTDNVATQHSGGIIVGDHSSVEFQGNLIARNRTSGTGGGITLFNGSTGFVYNNTIVANQSAAASAIRVDGSSPAIANNIIAQNTGREAIWCDNMPSSAVVSYNDFWLTGLPVFNQCSEANSLAVDPRFVNSAGGDYHLASNSPLRNAGNPASAFNNKDQSRNTIGMFGGPKGHPGTAAGASATTVISFPNPSATGQAVTFTASVPDVNPTGTVTFRDGNTTLGSATLVNGSASITTSALAAGSHAITAAYGGDAHNPPSASSALTQTVLAPAATNSERLFRWAEQVLPQVFPKGAATQSLDIYTYRYYSPTGTYLAIARGRVILHNGRDWNVLDVGLLTDFLPPAIAAGF